MEARVEAANFSNTPHFNNPNANINAGNFLQVTSAMADQRQLRLTTETAARQIDETQVQASRAISEAQELASRAQMLGDVLAAPDLIRFALVGRESLEAAAGQVLWSRSRGILVFSASGLPAPPQNSSTPCSAAYKTSSRCPARR